MKKNILLFLAVFAFLSGSGCSKNQVAISEMYRLETTTWGVGDVGWKNTLFGKRDRNHWTKLWHSLPICYEGKTWILDDSVLVFIGWAKNQQKLGDRRLLVTVDGADPIDITDRVLKRALTEQLIPATALFGEDFTFDGIDRNGGGLVVIALALKANAGFTIAKLKIGDELQWAMTKGKSPEKVGKP